MKHETEIESLLIKEKLDILFLCETDCAILNQDYRILNYKTVIHHKSNERSKTRIIALINDDIFNDVKIRDDMEISNYPIITLEIKSNNCKKLIVTGVYRQWGSNQEFELEQITNVVDKIGDEKKDHLILGDINLDKSKFDTEDYRYKKLRDILLNCLSRNDLKMANLGPTYLSKIHGTQSELDHIYYSATLNRIIKPFLGDCSASDHLQIIVDVQSKKRPPLIVPRNSKWYVVIKILINPISTVIY